MEMAQKVIWAEGVFLGQQHFQQWDCYLENQQQQLIRAVAPFAWGLLHLQIDEDALLNNKFSLRKLTAVMPNSQLINYDRSTSELLSCTLQAMPDENIAIYLGIPQNQQINGISGYQTNSLATWQAEYKPVRDLFDTNREREVLFGRLNLTVLTERDGRDAFHCLKIAEVTAAPHGGFQLVKNFIPALLKIQASFYLQEILNSLMELTGAKIRLLNQRRNQFNGEISQFGQNDLEHFLLLQTLNRFFPLLRHWQQNLIAHPQSAFLTLIELASSLCTFTDEISALELPLYQHDNLTESFGKLDKVLRDLLEKVMPTRMLPLKLRRESDTLYLIDNIETSLLQRTQFYIAVFFQSDDAQWIAQFARQVKVGSARAIDSIVTSALPGVRVTHLQRPPTKLPIKAGYEYFYLEPAGNFWDQVKAERTLGIFVPFGFVNANLELVTIQD